MTSHPAGALNGYDLSQGRRVAYFYVFNEFDPDFVVDGVKRNGRPNDVDLLQEVLQKRDFEVHRDGSANRMDARALLASLQAVAQKTERTACLMVFILTCSWRGGGLAYSGSFSFAEVLEPFMESNCSPALKGKPKIIFVQKDFGVVTERAAMRREGRPAARSENEYPVTLDPHCLVGYFERTGDGQVSMARALSQEMNKGKKHSINDILTMVTKRNLWEKRPKFSSTLTDNFPIPDPAPAPGATREPAARNWAQSTRLASPGPRQWERNHTSSRWDGAPSGHVSRELELYREAQRELAIRRKKLEALGVLQGEERRYRTHAELDDSSSGEEWENLRRWEAEERRRPRGSDRYGGSFLSRLLALGRRQERAPPPPRSFWADSFEDSRYRDSEASRYGRREQQSERLLCKAAPADASVGQGDEEAVAADNNSTKDQKEEEEKPMDEDLPWEEDAKGDILMALACTAGHISFQSTKGSVFIRSVCQAMESCGDDDDLLTVITTAMTHVALNIDVHGSKQMPTFTSSLRKQLAFGH